MTIKDKTNKKKHIQKQQPGHKHNMQTQINTDIPPKSMEQKDKQKEENKHTDTQ